MKRAIVVSFCVALAACGTSEPTPPATSWSDNVQAFCQAKDARWLEDVLDRVRRALPEEFSEGSLQFESMNRQAPFDGRPDASELQLRLSAMRAGEAVKLSAYGLISPDSCTIGDMEAIEGFDRFEPPLHFAIPD